MRYRTAEITLLIAFIAAAVALSCFSPRFVFWRALNVTDEWLEPEVSRAPDALRQIDAPFSELSSTLNREGMRWRLLFPVAWHVLDLPKRLFLAMPQIGCVLVLWLVSWLSYARLKSWPQVFLVSVLFAALPWFFVSTGWLAYFDSWFVLGMLCVAFVPSRYALAAAFLFTPWIDERFIAAAPLCLVVRWLTLAFSAGDLLCVSGSLLYVAVRIGAAFLGDHGSADYAASHRELLRSTEWHYFARAMWESYRVAWLPIAAGLYYAIRQDKLRGTCLVALTIALCAVSMVAAADMSRSLMIISPMALLGLWQCAEHAPSAMRLWLPLLFCANLAMPASHVMWNFQVPIKSAITEYRSYYDPPAILSPEYHVERAIQFAADDNSVMANRYFYNALALDAHCSLGYLERGIWRVRIKDIPGAVSDVQLAVKYAPRDWDHRAQAEHMLETLRVAD